MQRHSAGEGVARLPCGREFTHVTCVSCATQRAFADCGGSCDVCDAGKSCLVNGDCASNQCESGVCKSNAHSPKLGYAFDGFPIYGPFTDGGVLPTDLDVCNGRTHPSLGYIYHVSPTPPYGPGCYAGEVICTTVKSIPGCVTASQLTGTGAGDTHDCASLNAELSSGASPNQVPWTVDASKVPTRAHCGREYCPNNAAYSWDYDAATSLGLTSSVSCSDPTQSQAVQIDSNGVPDHNVGKFPLDHAGSTTGRAGVDNPNTVRVALCAVAMRMRDVALHRSLAYHRHRCIHLPTRPGQTDRGAILCVEAPAVPEAEGDAADGQHRNGCRRAPNGTHRLRTERSAV